MNTAISIRLPTFYSANLLGDSTSAGRIIKTESQASDLQALTAAALQESTIAEMISEARVSLIAHSMDQLRWMSTSIFMDANRLHSSITRNVELLQEGIVPDWSRRAKRVLFAVQAFPFHHRYQNRYHDLTNTAFELTQLGSDWDLQGSNAVTESNALVALSVISKTFDAFNVRPFLYPAPDGGMFIEWDSKPRRITVLVENGMGMLLGSDPMGGTEIFEIDTPQSEDLFATRIRSFGK